MTPKNAFKFSAAIRLHFSNLDYEMQKYGINTRAANAQWDKLSEAQRYRFNWLADTYINDQELVLTLIGLELSGLTARFSDKDDIKKASAKIRSRRNAIVYNIENESIRHNHQSMHQLILHYFSGNVIPEYMLYRDPTTETLRSFLNRPDLSFARTEIIKLIKYRTFFNPLKHITRNETASV